MMSVDLQKAHDRMLEIGESLTAYDFDSNMWVYVKHQDGTEYRFNSAFAFKYIINNQDFLLVFTEHNGYHAFSIGDLDMEAQFGGFYAYKMDFTDISYHPNSDKPIVRIVEVDDCGIEHDPNDEYDEC